MSQFDQAIALIHDTLTQLRQNASGPVSRASLASLAHLVEATRQTPAESQPNPVATVAVERPPERTSGLGLAARARAVIESQSSPGAAQVQSAPSAQPPIASPAPIQPDTGIPSVIEGTKAERMERLRQRALACVKCPHLAVTRSQVVFGVGNIGAELMFVGEAPGADEDLQGEPFVGKAGQLLTKIIEAMGFQRSGVYIGNVLKCRPDMPPGESGNRKPRPEEMATCLPYLIEQIEIIQPKCLVALGATAMEGLLGQAITMRDVRGRWHSFKGIPLMPTYHPAYLLRNQSMAEKRKVWEDMMQVLEILGKPISQKQRGFFLPKG